ncbi:hypothetical protein EVAR_17816_1 [Eumeta japonica]|uniref:RRM domain-containing protein n=1 Tax=Eumeta variegata TaxID=151549 RepID=A0A4C1TTJ9_EUMVA|nr:hypothetical protein EVAR_17816_1 [Eumeta japonica]
MEKKELKKKKHKSRTFIENQKENEIIKLNTTFDFANLYTSASETSIITSKKPKHTLKNDDVSNKKQNKIESVEDTPILFKKKFSKSELNKLKTSTPNAPNEKGTSVKSIMKNNSVLDNDAVDESNEISTSFESGKRKKRTKSVSFMLDDGEEVSQKKSKPNKMELDSSNSIKKNREKKKMKALDKNECPIQLEQATLTSNLVTLTKKKKKKHIDADLKTNENEFNDNNSDDKKKPKKSRNNLFSSNEMGDLATLNKNNKKKIAEKITEGEIKNDNINPVIEKESNKSKYKKKYKHKISNIDVNKEEPDKTSRKINEKAENVVEDLESLTIGDNAHTLTNLLDEMTVADKNKKNKRKKTKEAVVRPEENLEADKKHKKDKDKWKKRRLHRKLEFRGNDVTTSIVVDNLPIRLLFDYKDPLREHFSKFGLIRRIGVAEVYPTEEPKPVFTTTVHFFSEEAATSHRKETCPPDTHARLRRACVLPTKDLCNYDAERSSSTVVAPSGRLSVKRPL